MIENNYYVWSDNYIVSSSSLNS